MMPSALSRQNDYYARHHRRQSSMSMSQSSLPDQLKNSIAAAYSPSRSAVFLPATTYGQGSSLGHPSSPSVNSLIGPGSSISQTGGTNDSHPIANDPDDYYRQYQSQYAQPTEGFLRQGALQTELNTPTSRSFTITSQAPPPFEPNIASPTKRRQSTTTFETSKSQPQLSTSRGRKASVKNLVAQINASSTDEAPPLPSNPISQPGSRSISPNMASTASYYQQANARSATNAEAISSRGHANNFVADIQQGLGLSVDTIHVGDQQGQRKPLFGEVVPGYSAILNPGYGIQKMRQRSGSEGSPILSNRPRFQAHDVHNTIEHASIGRSHDEPAGHFPELQVTVTPNSRRATSDSPVTPIRDFLEDHSLTMSPTTHAYFGSEQTGTPLSRGTRANRPANLSSHAVPRPPTPTSGSGVRTEPVTPKRSSPRRRQRSPQIQTPGRGHKSSSNLQAGSKSPSLQANIIIPPPKLSPPLRSSRPRQPVSSASTAASRARMAEKFNTAQKIHNEKRTTSRKPAKPPELSDIDLKARRLRITQALSRSLEGQDLKGMSDIRRRATSSTRTASPSYSERSQPMDFQDTAQRVPSITIDDTVAKTSKNIVSHNQTETLNEEQHYTQHALHLMQGAKRQSQDDIDSPTLGRGEGSMSNGPSPIQTDFLRVDLENEPSSALTNMTAETEGTTIDLEPQTDDYSAWPASQAEQVDVHLAADSHQRSSQGELSDRADEESVHLILRDTTYLDESEAIRAGYRRAAEPVEPVPQIPESYRRDRSSWTPSMEGYNQNEIVGINEISRMDSSSTAPSDDDLGIEQNQGPNSSYLYADHSDDDRSNRSTMASNAYTVVNIVLQQHSLNGVVDQQFVDDVYQRVLQTSPYDKEDSLSTKEIEQLCLREIQSREDSWRKSVISGRNIPQQSFAVQEPSDIQHRGAQPQYQDRTSGGLSLPPGSKTHRYKSSLDSVEDWADTSPSVSDWMRFAVGDGTKGLNKVPAGSLLRHETDGSQTTLVTEFVPQPKLKNDIRDQEHQEDPELYAGSASYEYPDTPPALPAKNTPQVDQKAFSAGLIEPPQVPQRLTSLSQTDQQSQPASSSTTIAKSSIEDSESPDHRLLKRRKHVIKELVDTEYSYEKDLRVLCDIYKQTAPAALSEDDIKVLFGNIEQVQDFSESFLAALKSAAKPSYAMERADRKKEKLVDESSARPESSSSTLASIKVTDGDTLTQEKDRETRIGQAFELTFARMEKVYADYIRNRHAANQRLEAIQKSTAAREWLKECRKNSSDITNAWNLDALLVKPVQRITKYPLLLRELTEATPNDHPDLESLKRAVHEVTEVNIRINEVKKHTELMDQVFNRKRKDSDVRIGFSKAFGRRAEKLKQHLGTAEMYEDNEYNEIKINYDNNIVQLMVVSHDCSTYGRAISRWVSKLVEIAAAGEAWVDVGPSNHQEAESKLRHFAMVTGGISTIALPDHLEQLEVKVLNPMQNGVDLMNKFKNDPKGLLQKRDKRMIDYAQAKNKKDKGEKVDKKMAERMEQWEALNVEAKQRMKKLIKMTAVLVQMCQRNLLEMQMSWMKMIQTKLSTTRGINLEKLDRENIEKEWQVDFDFQQATALTLGICNGALLADAVNMVNIHSLSTHLSGEDSPRQQSYSSAQKRSISIHSNGSHTQLVESLSRNSAPSNRQNLDITTERGQSTTSSVPHTTRERAVSASVATPHRFSENSYRNGIVKHPSAGVGVGAAVSDRPEERAATVAPRLSVETPSPFIGSLQPEPNNRPPSSSTFFSAAADVPPNPRHQSNTSSIFSSAMPMPDSPVVDRQTDSSSDPLREPEVLFTAASVYEFNIDRSRREAGFPYLTYVIGEIFDILGENGELWLAKNQDDPHKQIGWIWNKHFAKLAD